MTVGWIPRMNGGTALAIATIVVACAWGCVPPLPDLGPSDADGDTTTNGTNPSSDTSTAPGDTTLDDTGACPADVPVLELGFSPIKRFDFTWAAVPGAERHQLLERARPGEAFVPLGDDIVGGSISLEMPLHLRAEASYLLRACDAAGCCTDSAPVSVMGSLVEAIGYLKASDPATEDVFGGSVALSDGGSVALSDDGSTLAVGAPGESSVATGIGEDPGDDLAPYSGAVYVFVRGSIGQWTQQAYIKASNADAGDRFGDSVALSADGSTLAVGAHHEGSNATGIDGDQANDLAPLAGAVYVYVRDPVGQWSKQAYVKASNTGEDDYFGSSVALSDDGNTLAVGAVGEASRATGIDGDQDDDAAAFAGAAYVYVRDGDDEWSQQAYVKASSTDMGDRFGHSVALSGDGDALAVGALYADVDVPGGEGSAASAGAVYVLVRDGNGTWSQHAELEASNPGPHDNFGRSVALSSDGSTLAVGAPGEDGDASGIDGDQASNSSPNAGAVYVLVRDGDGPWSQQAYVKASNPEEDDAFGSSVALGSDGRVLAVGAPQEDGNASGVGGSQVDEGASSAGAVYVLLRDGAGSWSHEAYVKASNPGAGDEFGGAVGLSGDADTLAVGAALEDGGASGIGGDQADESAEQAGAVYLY